MLSFVFLCICTYGIAGNGSCRLFKADVAAAAARSRSYLALAYFFSALGSIHACIHSLIRSLLSSISNCYEKGFICSFSSNCSALRNQLVFVVLSFVFRSVYVQTFSSTLHHVASLQVLPVPIQFSHLKQSLPFFVAHAHFYIIILRHHPHPFHLSIRPTPLTDVGSHNSLCWRARSNTAHVYFTSESQLGTMVLSRCASTT